MTEPAAYVTSALHQFAGWGERTALVKGERSMSFTELLSLAHRTARVLWDHGLGRGDGLVLLAANPLEMTAVGLAAHILGIRYTPVYAGGGARSTEHILRDAAPSAVVSMNSGRSTSRSSTSARSCASQLLATMPPSTFRHSQAAPSPAKAAIRSCVWCAIASSAARTICARPVAKLRPVIAARASGRQCGAPSPASAGTM